MKNAQRQGLVALVAGLVFAIGLGVAGMTDPNKVLNFLDPFGDWDPSLALVMLAAILAYMPVYRLLKGRSAPRFGDRFHWPTAKDIDAKLVVGAVLFGVGWGLVGFCPGPAVVAATAGTTPLLVYALALVTGMVGYQQLMRTRGGASNEDPPA